MNKKIDGEKLHIFIGFLHGYVDLKGSKTGCAGGGCFIQISWSCFCVV
jgi:hypothetical protein